MVSYACLRFSSCCLCFFFFLRSCSNISRHSFSSSMSNFLNYKVRINQKGRWAVSACASFGYCLCRPLSWSTPKKMTSDREIWVEVHRLSFWWIWRIGRNLGRVWGRMQNPSRVWCIVGTRGDASINQAAAWSPCWQPILWTRKMVLYVISWFHYARGPVWFLATNVSSVSSLCGTVGIAHRASQRTEAA